MAGEASLRPTLFALALMAATPFAASAQEITVGELSFTPTVDGSAAEWSGVDAATIALTQSRDGGKSDVTEVSLKSGIAGDRIYFLLRWKDASEDDQHKPFVWDEGKGKYVAGPQREDRMAIQFAMEGAYSADWLAGSTFVADTWHWKAARTNANGIAHDKRTIVGKEKMKKSYKGTAKDGSTLYIKRPGDKGDKLYKTKRYTAKEGATMPKYILAENPLGSIADVTAKGVWGDGGWTLELSRKLNTGNADDVAFTRGSAVKGGIAAFNRSGDDDHNVSATLTFQIQ